MKVIILAGGVDTRLFPLTREECPKYFLKIGGEHSLLAQSILRYAPIVAGPEDVLVVTGAQYESRVRNELAVCGMGGAHIILEPEFRNTAPAIFLALSYCKSELRCARDEIIFVSNADHLISPVNVFLRNMKKGLALTSAGKVVLFGVKPSRPEVNFSYIKSGDKLGNGYKISEFHEKPDLEQAKKYAAAGDYYWNWGIYVSQFDIFCKSLRALVPELSEQEEFCAFDYARDKFKTLPRISLKQALVRTDNMALVLLNCFWNDVGTLDALYEVSDKDEEDNVSQGAVVAVACKGSMFLGKDRLIAGVGLTDTVVVETDDVVLVTQKGQGQNLAALAEKLHRETRPQICRQTKKIYMPWGSYTIIEEGTNFTAAKALVDPGALMDVNIRGEGSKTVVVTNGRAAIFYDGGVQEIEAGQSAGIACGQKCKIGNQGKDHLEMIVLECGGFTDKRGEPAQSKAQPGA